MSGTHVQANASLTSTASATATIWAAISGARFAITRGFVTTYGPGAGAEVNIMEVTSGGTSAATLFNVPCVTADSHWMDFGEHGFTASAKGSRLVWAVAGANATVNCVFIGYHRG